jgi:hypothetical protein
MLWQRSRTVFGGNQIRITSALTDFAVRGFPDSLQVNAGIAPLRRPPELKLLRTDSTQFLRLKRLAYTPLEPVFGYPTGHLDPTILDPP